MIVDIDFQVITGFYQMLPPPPPTSSSEDLGTSKDLAPSSSYLSLTDALRISISGESMEYEEAAAVSSGEPAASSSGEQLSDGSSAGLIVPSGMPVDLRVKLSLAMINLGQQVPEVHLTR